jgi:putative FmdB family regulatory protein
MPIFEYRCLTCDHYFEALVLPPAVTRPECPSCHGRELEQLISAFTVNSEAASKAAFSKARRRAEKSIHEETMDKQKEILDHH